MGPASNRSVCGIVLARTAVHGCQREGRASVRSTPQLSLISSTSSVGMTKGMTLSMCTLSAVPTTTTKFATQVLLARKAPCVVLVFLVLVRSAVLMSTIHCTCLFVLHCKQGDGQHSHGFLCCAANRVMCTTCCTTLASGWMAGCGPSRTSWMCCASWTLCAMSLVGNWLAQIASLASVH